MARAGELYLDVQTNIRVGRLSLGKGEEEGEGYDLLRQRHAYPSPPAFARLRRGRQSSVLFEGQRREKAQHKQSP
jgi:hypothetical protein